MNCKFKFAPPPRHLLTFDSGLPLLTLCLDIVFCFFFFFELGHFSLTGSRNMKQMTKKETTIFFADMECPNMPDALCETVPNRLM